MAKDTTPSFIVELRLDTSHGDGIEIDKALDAGRMLFNACLGETLKRIDLMRESKAYRRTVAGSKSEERKEAFRDLRKLYKFSDYEIQAFAIQCKNSAQQIGKFLDTHTAQKVATRAYNACNKYVIGKGGRPRFKGKGQFDSLESKSNEAGIRYRDGWLMWRDIEAPCIIDPKDQVLAHGLSCRIKYCRIVRRKIGDKAKYYMQLVAEGLPCQKPRNKPGKEIVGIDIGPSTIAYVGKSKAELKQFCSELEPAEKRIGVLSRALDRSRKASNPGNYNHNGTVKARVKKWVYSKRYTAIRAELADLHRRRAAHRKSLHGRMCNDILRVGNKLRIEKNSYVGFQKNFGRSIGNRAPGMFVTGLIRKAESAGDEAWDIPSRALKMSQTCKCGLTEKKPLSERWHSCNCGAVAQRDLMSAFLARCAAKEDDKFVLDMSRTKRLWHEAEPLMMQAMSGILHQSANGRPLPSSFGLKQVFGLAKAPRQSGSPVKPGLRSETGDSTAANIEDVYLRSCSRSESFEKTAVASGRTPSL